MNGVLNETTRTVHKHDHQASDLSTACGAEYHLSPEQLRLTSVSRALTARDATKCGRCFDDGGGY